MSTFRYEIESGVAVVTFDVEGEAVNTISPSMSRDLEALLSRAIGDAEAKALVLLSGKKDSFIVGANVSVLQSLRSSHEAVGLSRQLQAALDRLAAFEKPVLAAIHGACLGGGLELALACDFRLVTSSRKTTLGLPEVQLGLLPGGGGTQRLPALIGAEAALDLILTGRTVKSQKALSLGLVDEVVPVAQLREVAIVRAREQAERDTSADRASRPFRDRVLESNPLGRKVLFDQARKHLLKKTHGKYPAPEKALEVVRIGLEQGMRAGLEAEAIAFGALLVTDVSRRLVEIFFATTAMKKDNGTGDPAISAREVSKIAVLGGGLMGAGIASVASSFQGVPVRVKDRDDAGVARALKHVRGFYDERVRRKSLTTGEADQQFARVTATTGFTGFKKVDLVIEAVFEDLSLKHQMLRDVERVCGPQTIFASNTSSIPITEIARAATRPGQVIGMHYFAPVHKMPLLEVITHAGTEPWVTATCVEAGKKQGKTVIVVNDGVGFYSSRILTPYLNEAGFLLTEGVEVEEIDRALTEFGFPVGPLTLLDDVGLDVAVKVAQIMYAHFGERLRTPAPLAALIDQGRLGRKAGKGIYRYVDGKKAGVDFVVPKPAVHSRIDRHEIAERCVLQMINEAIRCLGEGVLRSQRDGDIGAIFGLGFPAFLGGPIRHAETMGLGRTLARLEHYQERFGARFEPAPLLAQQVNVGRRFS